MYYMVFFFRNMSNIEKVLKFFSEPNDQLAIQISSLGPITIAVLKRTIADVPNTTNTRTNVSVYPIRMTGTLNAIVETVEVTLRELNPTSEGTKKMFTVSKVSLQVFFDRYQYLLDLAISQIRNVISVIMENLVEQQEEKFEFQESTESNMEVSSVTELIGKIEDVLLLIPETPSAKLVKNVNTYVSSLEKNALLPNVKELCSLLAYKNITSFSMKEMLKVLISFLDNLSSKLTPNVEAGKREREMEKLELTGEEDN